MNLFNTHRPIRFADVAQSHVTRILQAQVAAGDTASTYLFAGPSGTGKTTIARILAMALQDPERAEGTSEPTDSESSRLIQSKTHRDVIEINCADNNGVDDIRELIDRIRILPSDGKYRIVILDEVQMLTVQAQNAALKALEEPPSFVKFFLCTTDPHKIIGTIRSRCQIHTLRLVPDLTMKAIVVDICQKEKFPFEDAAIDLIVLEAAGGVRSAVRLLEKVANIGITEPNVRDTIGKGPRALAARLLVAAAEGNRGEVLQVIEATQSGGHLIYGLLEDAARMSMQVVKLAALKSAPEFDPVLSSVLLVYTPGKAIMAADRCLEAMGMVKGSLAADLAAQITMMKLVKQLAAK
jgi:DNA polymerase-3 subunit gamma/tau